MEVLIAAVILNIVGIVCKKLKFIPDNYIPALLAVVGVVGFMIYYWSSPMDWQLIIESGVVAAASSVYIHQNIKQILEKLSVSEPIKKFILGLIEDKDK